MDEIKLQATKIIARQILFSFVDINKTILSVFDPKGLYRVPMSAYNRFRQQDKIRFSQEIYRLRKAGLIKKYLNHKGNFLEITPKGKKKLKSYLVDQIQVEIPKKWDHKWRLVIFDIPKAKNLERDILRDKLERIGFAKLQKSVYVFPFDCQKIINLLKGMYFLGPYVQYIIADRIETEIDIISKFIDRGLLDKSNLSTKHDF